MFLTDTGSDSLASYSARVVTRVAVHGPSRSVFLMFANDRKNSCEISFLYQHQSISFSVLSVVWRWYDDSHSEMHEIERARNAGVCLTRPMHTLRQTYNRGRMQHRHHLSKWVAKKLQSYFSQPTSHLEKTWTTLLFRSRRTARWDKFIIWF